jgi:WhiB family redox-sensing transcriptional regulator
VTGPKTLPQEVADQSWRLRARCRDADPELFFPPPGPEGMARAEQAKRICAECPVRTKCRAYGLAIHDQFAVLGGLSAYDRRQMRPPRRVAQCGTRSGYRRHRDNDERACAACKKANSEYTCKIERRRRERAPRKAAS